MTLRRVTSQAVQVPGAVPQRRCSTSRRGIGWKMRHSQDAGMDEGDGRGDEVPVPADERIERHHRDAGSGERFENVGAAE